MVKCPGIRHFCLTSKHRFHNVQKKLSLNKTETKCSIAEKKKKTPFECHILFSFQLADVGTLDLNMYL